MKSAIVQIDAAPFRQYYAQHYGLEVSFLHKCVSKRAVDPFTKLRSCSYIDGVGSCYCICEQFKLIGMPFTHTDDGLCLQIGLKKKTAAGAAAAAKEAEEHAKEAEKKSSNHVQRKLKARTQHHKLDEVSVGSSSCRAGAANSLCTCQPDLHGSLSLRLSWCEEQDMSTCSTVFYMPWAGWTNDFGASIATLQWLIRRHNAGARSAVCWRKAAGSHFI